MGIDRMKHFLFSIATAIIENMNQMTRNKLIYIHSLFLRLHDTEIATITT